MSTPEPPTPAPAAAAPAAPAPAAGAAAPAAEGAAAAAAPTKPAAPANPLGTAGYKPKPPPEPLQGWRAAFEHTGIPRSVLTAKPRLPSRNWCIFLSIVGGITYLYKSDRNEADRIREEYINKVKYLSEKATHDALEQPRKVKVYGARWPEDDESDRSLRYFRKYVKRALFRNLIDAQPYLVAAAIDYDQIHAPLYGSIARIVRAEVVKSRRTALGLEHPSDPMSLPSALDPAAEARRELEGGTILVGRPALKEYLAGLHAGWSHGVAPWVWETECEKEIAANDNGFFDEAVIADAAPVQAAEAVVPEAPAAEPTPEPAAAKSRWGFLSRSTPAPAAAAPTPGAPSAPGIPDALHTPPSPLPPQPPILFVPFVNHLGFKQIPYMIYDFFTEAKRTKVGAEAAYALITNRLRPFTDSDLSLGEDTEKFYRKDYNDVPEKNEKAKKKYYDELRPRLEAARQFARGERDLTDEEKRSDKPVVSEDDLRAERKKREMRWNGGLEGWNIVRPGTAVAWDPSYAGWLRMFDTEAAKKDE